MNRTQATACAAGDAWACVLAARSYAPQGAYRLTLSKDEADAREQGTLRYARRACDLNEADGCALVAQLGADPRMLARACDLGHPGACGMLALHTFARSAPRERKRALGLLERACVANATGFTAPTTKPGAFCLRLSQWYRDVFKDAGKAEQFRKLGCSQSDPRDCQCENKAACGTFPEGEGG